MVKMIIAMVKLTTTMVKMIIAMVKLTMKVMKINIAAGGWQRRRVIYCSGRGRRRGRGTHQGTLGEACSAGRLTRRSGDSCVHHDGPGARAVVPKVPPEMDAPEICWLCAGQEVYLPPLSI